MLAACDSQDDRPLELAYLTDAIFAPTCGTTQCHSTFRQAGHGKAIVLDNPEAARKSLVDTGLVTFDSGKYDPDDPNNADLMIWITQIDPFGLQIGRMPFDAPLPNKDVYLIREWIQNKAPGAQCDPEMNGGMACDDKAVVRCTADWTFGDRVMLCSGACVQGGCK